jgi:hypothetical protein
MHSNCYSNYILTRHATYAKRNTEGQTYSGKSMSITHAECVFVDLGIQHKMLVLHIDICGISDCKLFFHVIS